MEPLAAKDPKQIGPYRLHFRLGAGGMGRVFYGTSEAGRPAAVKVIHPELARDPAFSDRFRREVAAAGKVSAAFTAPVVAAGPDDDPPWLATLFVAGPSLAEAVAEKGPLPPEAVWRLAGGLVEALTGVHQRGLVHRDLKPANVLLAVEGPLVIDFGISRALEGTSLTTGSRLGTPAFMSPEQAEGKEAGPASDVFSLGSVIAFAATGTAPFAGGLPVAELNRVQHADPDLAHIAIPALRELVANCLAKDPHARPTLDQLARTITAGSRSYPDVSPGSFWPEPIASFIRSRHDSLLSQIRQIPPAPDTIHQPAIPPPTEPTHLAASPTRRRHRALIWTAGGLALAGVAAAGYILSGCSHAGATSPRHQPAVHAGCTSPKVVISTPKPGQPVPATAIARGTARCVPSRLTLWLIIQVGQGFYPQARINLPRGGTGAWAQPVTFGGAHQPGQAFTLYAVGADRAASSKFATYLQQVTAGSHPPALSQITGTYPQVNTYASTTVSHATLPVVSIATPRSTLNCAAVAPQCQFAVTGRSSGVTAGLQIFVLVFPVQPAGNGWYIQEASASVSGNGLWTQAPSYLGAITYPVHNGDTLQIEAVAVRPGATYGGIRLEVLASHAQPITDPHQIQGLVSQSDVVPLRVLK